MEFLSYTNMYSLQMISIRMCCTLLFEVVKQTVSVLLVVEIGYTVQMSSRIAGGASKMIRDFELMPNLLKKFIQTKFS